MKISTLMVTMLLIIMLPSCMVGPQYKRPIVKVPYSYRYAQTISTTETEDFVRWWDNFKDPLLAKLIAQALDCNYDLRIAFEKINEVAARYFIARQQLFPQIDGVITTERRHYAGNLLQFQFLPESERTINFLRFGMEVLWEIDIWGRLRRARNAAYADYQSYLEDMHGVMIVLVSDVATTYIDLRTLEKKIELLKERIACDNSLLSLQHERTTSGLDSLILLEETTARLAASQSQLPVFEIIHAQSINGLASLLGTLPEEFDFAPLKKPAVPQAEVTLDTAIPSDLLRRRPDIRRAERQLAAATERIGQAIADYFPRFNFLATVDAESSFPATWFAPGSLNWYLGNVGRWPFVDFGRVTYNVEAKKASERQAFHAYCKSVMNAFKEVESALVAYYKNKERLKFLQKQFAAVTQERDLKKSLLQAGVSDKSDYLLAERNRIVIEELLTDGMHDLSYSLITLYKALGGGWSIHGGMPCTK